MKKNADDNSLAEIAALTSKALKSTRLRVASAPIPSDVNCRISTGWTLLDAALDGGIPVGRLTELYGKSQSGKTSLALQIIRSAQTDPSSVTIYIDTEHTFDKKLATKMGVDLERVLIIHEGVGLNNIFDVVKESVEQVRKSGFTGPIPIVWDTISATVTSTDKEHKADALKRGVMMNESLRTFCSFLPTNNCALIMINHVHTLVQKGGNWAGPQFGPGGGLAPSFYSTMRIYLTSIGKIDDADKNTLGTEVRAKVDKSKLGSPMSKVKSRLYFGSGFDDRWSVFDYLKEQGVITGSGWYTIPFNETTIKTQPSRYIEDLEANPGLFEHLQTLAKEMFMTHKAGADDDAEDYED